MRKKLGLSGGLVVLALLSHLLPSTSQADLVCETYYGCRPVRIPDAIYCVCDTVTRNCTICCDPQTATCCSGSYCA